MEVEKDYASKGVAGAGLGTGIAGLALGVMNAAGGLGALALGNRNPVPTAPVMPAMPYGVGYGWGGCSENMPVSRYELDREQQLAAKDSEIALLKANAYNDQKSIELYAYIDGQLKLNQDEGVYYVTGHTENKEDATHFVPVKIGDTKGRILIKGLEDDTYAMTEVRTDNGYVLLKQDIEVVISQKESADSCTVYASDALGLIQNDPRYAQIIQSDADLKNIPQKHLEHKLLTASATVSGKKVNMAEDNGSTNAEAPLTVVNTRGFDLPKTGDNGTMMFTIVGILLMVGAATVLYLVSGKKSA